MKETIKISVVLPLFNGVKYIEESINSVLEQTYTNWEFIIVNDYGSDDGCADIVKRYAENDERIKLIQADTRLGLAQSLNVGIKTAIGDYIARVDVDDPSYPNRFQVQVDFLEDNPDVALCGTIQKTVLPNKSYIQKVPCEREELKATLIFGCEISHCSVMFRRQLFIEKEWFYDRNRMGEDFDLWTRIMFETNLVNIPEVLVEHRWGFDNISIEKGEYLRQEVREINARTLSLFEIKILEEDLLLLSGWRNLPKEFAQQDISVFLKKGYKLLNLITDRNKERKLINENALEKVLFKRWNWICQSCDIFFHDLEYEKVLHDSVKPKVSIIMTVYHNVYTIRETIESILCQDFEDWEFLIICEYGNDDGSNELAKYYAKLDKRIKVIENQEYLGVAGSLNYGISLAQGEYIARIDAFDLSNEKRLSTQIAYMDEHKTIGITQFYQHFFGKENINFTKHSPITSESIKTRLLFFNAICGSTLMYRTKFVKSDGIQYREFPNYEDYDFVLQLMEITTIETIPEVYGEYRVNQRNNQNDTNIKSNKFIQKQLNDKLRFYVSDDELEFLDPTSSYDSIYNDELKNEKLNKTQRLLWKIYKKNKKKSVFDDQELIKVMASIWQLKKYGREFINKDELSIYEALEANKIKLVHPRLTSVWKLFQKYKYRSELLVVKHQDMKLQDMTKSLEGIIEQKISKYYERQLWQIDKQIERWTWKRYKDNMYYQDSLMECLHSERLIPYIKGENIRIVFLIQVSAFYPSTQYLIDMMLSDKHYNIKVVCYDEPIDYTIKVDTTREFLEKKCIPYVYYKDFSLEQFAPHIIFLQTPYDGNRSEYWQSTRLFSKGYRIVYVPYGIEIADTQSARKAHFEGLVVNHAWRIYTLSDVMKQEYFLHCPNSKAVRALGIPRFDSLYNKEKFPLNKSILEKAKGRKIVLWKVHFPKIIEENKKKVYVTPDLDEYIQFLDTIELFEDLFFIFMPHPRFKEFNNDSFIQDKIDELFSTIETKENIFVDDSDDYRNSLLNADYIIIDRSAVMVEAAIVKVPILYMYNDKFEEPLTEAIKPLINSYYCGTTYKDMIKFLEMCKRGEDPNKKRRERAIIKCIPFFDGQCSKRIMEDIENGLKEERQDLDNIEIMIDKKLDQKMNELYLKIESLIVNKDDKENKNT